VFKFGDIDAIDGAGGSAAGKFKRRRRPRARDRCRYSSCNDWGSESAAASLDRGGCTTWQSRLTLTRANFKLLNVKWHACANAPQLRRGRSAGWVRFQRLVHSELPLMLAHAARGRCRCSRGQPAAECSMRNSLNSKPSMRPRGCATSELILSARGRMSLPTWLNLPTNTTTTAVALVARVRQWPSLQPAVTETLPQADWQSVPQWLQVRLSPGLARGPAGGVRRGRVRDSGPSESDSLTGRTATAKPLAGGCTPRCTAWRGAPRRRRRLLGSDSESAAPSRLSMLLLVYDESCSSCNTVAHRNDVFKLCGVCEKGQNGVCKLCSANIRKWLSESSEWIHASRERRKPVEAPRWRTGTFPWSFTQHQQVWLTPALGDGLAFLATWRCESDWVRARRFRTQKKPEGSRSALPRLHAVRTPNTTLPPSSSDESWLTRWSRQFFEFEREVHVDATNSRQH